MLYTLFPSKTTNSAGRSVKNISEKTVELPQVAIRIKGQLKLLCSLRRKKNITSKLLKFILLKKMAVKDLFLRTIQIVASLQ